MPLRFRYTVPLLLASMALSAASADRAVDDADAAPASPTATQPAVQLAALDPTAAPPAAGPTAGSAAVAATQPGLGVANVGVAGVSVADPQVTVSDAGTVEMHVNDASLAEVLRMLSLQSRRNIVASKEVTGHVTANLYNVTVAQALDAILVSNGYVYREKDNFIYVYSAKELADLDLAARKRATEVFRLYYTPAANAAAMIKPALSDTAQVAVTTPAQSGIDTATMEAGGNTHSAPTCWSSPTTPRTWPRSTTSLRKSTAARSRCWSRHDPWPSR